MNWKSFALRFAGLLAIALAMFPMFGLTMNLLVLLKLVPLEMMDKAMGTEIARQAMYVWLGCLIPAFASIFFQGSWRYILYFSPLYAPSLFAVVYTLMQ
jgi:hypothetical protein